MKTQGRVRVHLSLDKKDNTCFRFTNGNPMTKNKLEAVNFYDLSPLNLSGFLRFMYIKKCQLPEAVAIIQLYVVNYPMGIVRNDYRYQTCVSVMMSDQYNDMFSLYYQQYKEYVLGL